MSCVQIIRCAAIVATLSVAPALAQTTCKDCDPITGLTNRQSIEINRAKDAQRILDEGPGRPWDKIPRIALPPKSEEKERPL